MMIIMRYPEGHKEAVKDRIVRAAAGALRRHGVDGVSIPALMKQAGLTHGAFYAHFQSRDELVAAAVRSAAMDTARQTFADDLRLPDVLDSYLSTGHLQHPELGCVLAALGTDGARQAAPVRRAFAEVAKGFLRLVESKVHPTEAADEPSDEALQRAAMMIGAVVLGRLVRDPALAERILAAARAPVSR